MPSSAAGAAPRLAAVPTFKSAYLIHGDDHGRIAERRARLRSLAESLSGSEGLELLEGEDATPDAVARALDAMTLALGRRFVIVEGVERWKDKELDGLIAAVEHLAPETTVAFFAREDSRNKAPDRLHAAVKQVKGDISAESSLKPWELPKWTIARAAEMGIELEPDAARALIAHVGDRQQRLLRELEKLALGADPGGDAVDADDVAEMTASSAERRAWTVADALVAGDRAAAVRTYLQLREQGERLAGLLYWISQRVRQAHDVASAHRCRRAGGAGQAPPAHALPRRRPAHRRRPARRRRPPAPGDLRDRRPRAGLPGRSLRAAGPRTPRRCSPIGRITRSG